jgi:hypothetical protein
VSTPPQSDAARTRANKINGATCRDASLRDVQFTLNFEISSTSYSRAPAVTDHYAPGHAEIVGLAVRSQQSGEEYRVVIETALTANEKQALSRDVSDDDQPPPPSFFWTLSIHKISASGDDQKLGSLANSDRFTIVRDSPYVMTVNTVGSEI